MLLVRLSAADMRMIEKAETPQELSGLRTRMMDLIQQSLTLKEFGASPTVRHQGFTWKEAFKICKDVCGATMPPFPESFWFSKVNRALKEHGMDADFIQKLAEYAKANLRPNPSFEFLVVQHERVMSGEFNQRPANAGVTVPVAFGPSLPEE